MHLQVALLYLVSYTLVGLALYLPFFLWFRWKRMKSEVVASGQVGRNIPKGEMIWHVAFVAAMFCGFAQGQLAPETWFGSHIKTNLGRAVFGFALLVVAVTARAVLGLRTRTSRLKTVAVIGRIPIATVETDLFEHREVRPHFINDCCFGEDFAAWLIRRLGDVSRSGFELSAPVQEDHGWGFWAKRGRRRFWIALSYVGGGPTVSPAQWVISIAHDAGINGFKNLFGKPDLSDMVALRARIRRELESERDIKIVQGA